MTLDPWEPLRAWTPARVALGRAGTSMPTAARLRFNADHAAARDAVHQRLDAAALLDAFAAHGHGASVVRSAASDRRDYLLAPDQGRRLGPASRDALLALAAVPSDGDSLAIVVCDGLSPGAANEHAPTVVGALVEGLADSWRLTPISVVEGGRVAIGDEIGELLGASVVVVLIGERPGLSAPRSLGAYVTYRPHVGVVDAQRTCLSNIRPQGTEPIVAANQLVRLLARVQVHRATGLALDAVSAAGPGAIAQAASA
jgi:ethanolamine ammonia-lyase small subunit